MKTRFLAAVLAAAASALSLCAHAQGMMNGAYAGASLGTSEVKKFGCEGFTNACKKSGSPWRLFGGLRISPTLAAEIAYTDIGKFTQASPTQTVDTKVDAWDASALFTLPLAERFALYGKLGGYYARSAKSNSLGGTTPNENNGGLTYGLGAEYDLTRNFGLRADWQRYAKVGKGTVPARDIDVMSIGVLWKFR